MKEIFEYCIETINIAGLIIITWITAELSSYIWHRFASHIKDTGLSGKFLFRLVRKTHSEHHTKYNSNPQHKAFEDFIWVILGLGFLGVSLFGLFVLINAPIKYYSAIMGTSIIFSLWKCYIHAAYHTENHFLNKYSFFKDWKRDHLLHHNDPNSNYSLSCFIPDKIFGTYKSETQEIVKNKVNIVKISSLEDID